jgi:hypothetical protein
MLKHRNKSLVSNANVKGDASQQHPRSPSIDITSVFPQAAAGEGEGGGDAFQLFEEAFPYPETNEQALEKSISSPLIKLLSSPSIPTTQPTATGGGEIRAQAQASAAAKIEKKKERPSSIGSASGKGLKELELVKRRLSWESITPTTTPKALSSMMDQEEGEEMLTDEEKFQDALEEGEDESVSASLPASLYS